MRLYSTAWDPCETRTPTIYRDPPYQDTPPDSIYLYEEPSIQNMADTSSYTKFKDKLKEKQQCLGRIEQIEVITEIIRAWNEEREQGSTILEPLHMRLLRILDSQATHISVQVHSLDLEIGMYLHKAKKEEAYEPQS